MIVRTETYRTLEEDIATVMNLDEMSLFLKLRKIYMECFEGGESDWDKYERLIEEIITEHANLSIIDSIYVYHLARHFTEPNQLIPLNELLLTQNPFSVFLKEHSIEFKEQEGKLKFYNKGKLITKEEILDREHFHLFAKRLGYLGEEDFCVNGFAFWTDIEHTSSGYYRDLQRGPEFIENVGRFIGQNLLNDYREQSKYYGVVFKVPIDEVIFDGKDDVNTREKKVKCFIKYALFILNDFYANSLGENIMLRVDDKKIVKVDHCILIEE